MKIIRKSDLKFDSVGKVEAEREYTKRNATASGGNQERKSASPKLLLLHAQNDLK